jgi:hypothetical protein
MTPYFSTNFHRAWGGCKVTGDSYIGCHKVIFNLTLEHRAQIHNILYFILGHCCPLILPCNIKLNSSRLPCIGAFLKEVQKTTGTQASFLGTVRS